MEENKNKVSFLKEIEAIKNKLDADKSRLNSHVLMMMEVDEQGTPIGFITSVAGGPVVVLGIAELLMAKMDNLREVVHEKVDNMEQASKAFNKKLPAELQEKLKELELRARRAMQEDNLDEAEKIAMEVKDLLKEYLGDVAGIKFNDEDSDGSLPKSDFNLNDFKDM